MMQFRVGIGYDIHRLVKGRRLFIGGVEIPYDKGLLGHSDADVLLHAVCDALLGAVGKGDIGELFPDTDPAFKGIASAIIAKKVKGILDKEGFEVSNIDTVIIAEKPKFSLYKGAIQKSIADILGLPEGAVAVKAKTNEGLGELGRSKAIAAFASAIVTQSSA